MHNLSPSASARAGCARMASRAAVAAAMRSVPFWCAAAVLLAALSVPGIAAPPPPDWAFSFVEGSHGFNQSSMCRNGGNGVEAVYYDLLTTSLHHASKLDKTQDNWFVETVPGTGNYGSWPSIARGSDGRLHVAYYEVTIPTATLKYVCRGTNGVWSSPVTVAFVGVCQGNCSLVLDNSGVPVVAFNTGNYGDPVRTLKIYKQQPDGTWAQFGPNYPSAEWPHHIALAGPYNDNYWVFYIDQAGARLNLWKYNGYQWLLFPYVTFAAGPYTDASIALDQTGSPMLAYGANGSLIFQHWALSGDGFDPPETLDSSLGAISGVSIRYGWLYPRIAYVGAGTAKLATGVYSETEWPCAWELSTVETGSWTGQISIVMTSSDDKWLLYTDGTTNGMRSAAPVWVDVIPPDPSPYLTALCGCTLIKIQWQATGDDGMVGNASAYDLRWALTPITTEQAFAAATIIPTGTPGPPGTNESVFFEVGKCSPKYYFALKTGDNVGNWSTLKSDPTGAKTMCPRPPRDCLDEFGEVSAQSVPPSATRLIGLRPNPANAFVDVDYELGAPDESAPLDLAVYNVAGQRVATLKTQNPGAGLHTVRWDLKGDSSRPVSAGIYFVRFRVAQQTTVQKMIVVR